jgi:hypothetical protein
MPTKIACLVRIVNVIYYQRLAKGQTPFPIFVSFVQLPSLHVGYEQVGKQTLKAGRMTL